MLRREQRRYASTSATTWVNPSALEQYDLGGVDCPDCGNTGYILERGEGILEVHSYECWCMKRRRTLRALRKAGMEDMAQRCTLESYRTDTPQCAAIAEAARRFIAADSGWFFIAGQSGSGKTHICTAICTGLMEQKGKEIDFMPWLRRDPRVLLRGPRYGGSVLKRKGPELNAPGSLFVVFGGHFCRCRAPP